MTLKEILKLGDETIPYVSIYYDDDLCKRLNASSRISVLLKVKVDSLLPLPLNNWHSDRDTNVSYIL